MNPNKEVRTAKQLKEKIPLQYVARFRFKFKEAYIHIRVNLNPF
jgi:hypothetical protein